MGDIFSFFFLQIVDNDAKVFFALLKFLSKFSNLLLKNSISLIFFVDFEYQVIDNFLVLLAKEVLSSLDLLYFSFNCVGRLTISGLIVAVR